MTTTKFIRAFILSSFAVLVLFGVLGRKSDTVYVPSSPSAPVLSVTVDSQDVNEDTVTVSVNTADFPENSASACALISADSGEALYLKNADTLLPMASTTKIMTALVAMETLSPETVVTIPAEACGVEGSSIYLVPGEQLTVKDLLYGLLLESGNDAATALAVCAGGDVQNFVKRMNDKAQSMGLIHTHFDNPHGLYSDKHRTTAQELAAIAYHAMKVPLFRSIVGTKSYICTDANGTPTRYFSNHNRLLKNYSGATGIKTGYTIASGRCLVTSAKRDNTEFIVVTLNDRNDFADHRMMLDSAFGKYETVHIAKAGDLGFYNGGNVLYNMDDICFTAKKSDVVAKYEITIRLTSP